METVQNWTELDSKHQVYIDFVASGGMEVIDGSLNKISAEVLAKKLKVARTTLYNWREMDGFWEMVQARRNILYSRDRMSMVYNAVFKKSLQGDIAASKLLMAQAKILEAEHVDLTTNGKDIPTPIFGGQSIVGSDQAV